MSMKKRGGDAYAHRRTGGRRAMELGVAVLIVRAGSKNEFDKNRGNTRYT
jgi:hypothetical protein